MSGSNIALREWESVGPEDPLRGHVLKGIRLREEDRDLARALTRSGALEIRELADGLLLGARAHVGRIKLGALTITVAPKIGDGELLALFRYAYGLSDLKRLGAASYSLTGGLFQDLIMAQLHAEVRMLLERGIVRTYVGRSDDINSPRGKIDFARLAARGGAVEATLPCRHYPRSSDNLLNRTLLGGLTLAQRMAQDAALSRDVGRLTHRMSSLASPSRLSADLIDRASMALNRLVADYTSAIRLVEVLYGGSHIELGQEAEPIHIPGFLFDMNRFFQSLVHRFLTSNLPECHVETERGLTGMMRYALGKNPKNRRSPAPRPDFAVSLPGSPAAYIDAKYRDLWERALPREMLYQLTVYALSQAKGATAAILYPTVDMAARESVVEVVDPSKGTNIARVALRPVRLRELVTLLETGGKDAASRCRVLAAESAGLSSAIC